MPILDKETELQTDWEATQSLQQWQNGTGELIGEVPIR